MKISVLSHKQQSLLLFLMLLVTIVGIEYWVTTLPQFSLPDSPLPLAVSIDLVLVLPIIYYFLLVCKKYVSTYSLLFIVSLGLSVGYYLLPTAQQTFLRYVEKGFILVELGVLVYVLTQIRNIIRTYQALSTNTQDFITNIHASFSQHLGNSPLIHFLVGELIMLRYSLFFWLKTKSNHSNNEFSLHQEAGFVAVMLVLLFISLVEMAVLHLLVSPYFPLVAWVLLAISVYGSLFLVAHLFAVVQRKIVIQTDTLFIRVGMIWNFEIPTANVQGITQVKSIDTTLTAIDVAKPLLASPNLLITLKEPMTINGIYGISKTAQNIYVVVDKPSNFLDYFQSNCSLE